MHSPVVTEDLLLFQHPRNVKRRKLSRRNRDRGFERALLRAWACLQQKWSCNSFVRSPPFCLRTNAGTPWLCGHPCLRSPDTSLGWRPKRFRHLVVGFNQRPMFFLIAIPCAGGGDAKAPGPLPSPPDTQRCACPLGGEPQRPEAPPGRCAEPP